MKNLTQYINESLKDWDRHDWLDLKDAYDTNHAEELANIVDKHADEWSCWKDQQLYFCVWYMVKYAKEEIKKSKDAVNNAPFYFDGSHVSDRKTSKSIPDAVADGKHSWKEVADAIQKYYE